MAPAVVLCLMTILLGFLQFTYWDMSVKRQQAKNLKTAFIALAEADMAPDLAEHDIALVGGLGLLPQKLDDTLGAAAKVLTHVVGVS